MAKKRYYSSDKKCIVTGSTPVDLHHVRTRGAGGSDDAWNLMPLTHSLHVEVHKLGLIKFSLKYEAVRMWLESNGWALCSVMKRWRRKSGD